MQESQTVTDQTEIERQVRSRLSALESAWNRPDLDAVMAQYDPAFTFICVSQRHDYAQYMKELRSLFAQEDRSELQLGIKTIRVLGKDYALLEGSVQETFNDREVRALFTVIYQRLSDQWMMIHAHTSYA